MINLTLTRFLDAYSEPKFVMATMTVRKEVTKGIVIPSKLQLLNLPNLPLTDVTRILNLNATPITVRDWNAVIFNALKMACLIMAQTVRSLFVAITNV